MKTCLRFFTLAFIAYAAATAAAAVKVRSDYDKKFDFRSLKTFAWREAGPGDVMVLQRTGDKEAVRAEVEPMIVRSVEQVLPRRGFTLAAAGTPADLYVSYYVLVGPNINAQTMGQFLAPVPQWGIPPFAPVTQSYEVYEQGTLILDLTSPALKSMVWRGSAQTEVDREVTSEVRERRIRDAVQEMFKNFPPKR
jgi:hypothetical protein